MTKMKIKMQMQMKMKMHESMQCISAEYRRELRTARDSDREIRRLKEALRIIKIRKRKDQREKIFFLYTASFYRPRCGWVHGPSWTALGKVKTLPGQAAVMMMMKMKKNIKMKMIGDARVTSVELYISVAGGR
jgi:hypothetical protein